MRNKRNLFIDLEVCSKHISLKKVQYKSVPIN